MRTHRHRFVLASCIALALAGSAVASPDTPAVSRSHRDAALEWGPCPDFLPKGCGLAVLHGDPSKAGADVFFRVPGKAAIPVHWHSSAERMVLVAGRLRVTYDGQAPVTLEAGTYAYGPARHPHEGRCESTEPCVLFIAFDGPVDAHAGRPSA